MKIFKLFSLFLFFLVPILNAQNLESPPFYIPYKEPMFSRGFGFGARAMGMGGAFIAVGDDSTAASWNPAGLARMMSLEFGMVGRYWRGETTETPVLKQISPEQIQIGYKMENMSNYQDTSQASSIDLLSFAMPYSIKGKKAFSFQFSYQRNYKFLGEREIKYNIDKLEKTGAVGYSMENIQTQISDTQNGGLDSLSFSLAATIKKRFHIGITFNLWKGMEEREYILNQDAKLIFGNNNYVFERNLQVKYDGEYSGTSFNLGILLEASDYVHFGFVYKPGFKLEFERKNSYFKDDIIVKDAPFNMTDLDNLTVFEDIFASGDIDFPEQWGIGIAYRPNPKWTLAFDIGSTLWSKAKFENEPFPINYGFTMNFPFYGGENYKAKDSFTYRFGLEKLIGTKNYIFALRSGIFYERSLLVSRWFDQPSGIGFSLGGGLLYKNLLVDTAIVYDTTSIKYKNGNGIYQECYQWDENGHCTSTTEVEAEFTWEGNQKNGNFQFLLSAFYRF